MKHISRRSVLTLMGASAASMAVATPVFATDKVRIALVVKALGIGFFAHRHERILIVCRNRDCINFLRDQ